VPRPPLAISLEGSALSVAVEFLTKPTKLGAPISLAPDENNRSAATYPSPVRTIVLHGPLAMRRAVLLLKIGTELCLDCKTWIGRFRASRNVSHNKRLTLEARRLPPLNVDF
jgi:hypothetical protein